MLNIYGESTPLTIDYSSPKVIVATVYGPPYYKIINALKEMNLQFESLSPEEAAISDAKIIITTKAESSIVNRKDALLDTELNEYYAIVKSKILRNVIGCKVDDSLCIGIDPGMRIGVSVMYYNKELDSFVESSLINVINKLSLLFSKINSKKKILKIGNGDLEMAKKIAFRIKDRFDNVYVEIVDEHRSSAPSDMGINRRGMRDRSAARIIALRKGQPFVIQTTSNTR
jgi:hypothetical protein